VSVTTPFWRDRSSCARTRTPRASLRRTRCQPLIRGIRHGSPISPESIADVVALSLSNSSSVSPSPDRVPCAARLLATLQGSASPQGACREVQRRCWTGSPAAGSAHSAPRKERTLSESAALLRPASPAAPHLHHIGRQNVVIHGQPMWALTCESTHSCCSAKRPDELEGLVPARAWGFKSPSDTLLHLHFRPNTLPIGRGVHHDHGAPHLHHIRLSAGRSPVRPSTRS
jgi:hypothetical protein